MIRAFILGLFEFKSDMTTNTGNPVAYDWGREVAHRITFRRYDHA
jgi:hypothetical protein